MSSGRTRARGELEGEVMRILWEHDEPLPVGEILEEFTGRTPAYTTLLTALDRLHKKGQVIRAGDSPRRLLFQAARSKDEHTSEAMLAALHGAGDRHGALLRFAGNLDADDLDLLRSAIGPRSSDDRRAR